MSSKNMNLKIRDSLFSDKNRLIELYKSLVDDESKISAEDIEIITLENIITTGVYNDLGFRVKDEIIILMEAQSVYTENIVIRVLFYLSDTLKDYIERNSPNKNLVELYSTKKRMIPKIKLFTVYTGDKLMEDHDLHLSDLMVESNIVSDIDMKVRVLCTGNKNNILGQYILFTQIFSRQKNECNNIEEAIKNTIEICMNEEILKEYLSIKKTEVQDMVNEYMKQETAFKIFMDDQRQTGLREGRAEGIKEGEKKGREEGKIDTLINFFKNGVGIDVISKAVGMSIEEIKSILIGRGFEV